MSQESQVMAPICQGPIEVLVPPLLDAPLPPEAFTTPSPDHVRATEAAFTKDHESAQVAGLLGMWTGTLLLHDLAVEHFEERDEVKEEREKKEKKAR